MKALCRVSYGYSTCIDVIIHYASMVCVNDRATSLISALCNALREYNQTLYKHLTLQKHPTNHTNAWHFLSAAIHSYQIIIKWNKLWQIELKYHFRFLDLISNSDMVRDGHVLSNNVASVWITAVFSAKHNPWWLMSTPHIVISTSSRTIVYTLVAAKYVDDYTHWSNV